MSKDGKITNRGVERLVAAIADGEDVRPEDVRAAISRIYESRTIEGRDIMLDQCESAYLSLAISRFLDGKLSLDQAFGRVRSRPGHPGVPRQVQMRMARAVWEQYLPGRDSLDAVATRVGDEFGKEKKQVLKYFQDNFLASYSGFVYVHRRPTRGNTLHENRRFSKLNRYHEEREIRLASAPGARSRS